MVHGMYRFQGIFADNGACGVPFSVLPGENGTCSIPFVRSSAGGWLTWCTIFSSSAAEWYSWYTISQWFVREMAHVVYRFPCCLGRMAHAVYHLSAVLPEDGPHDVPFSGSVADRWRIQCAICICQWFPEGTVFWKMVHALYRFQVQAAILPAQSHVSLRSPLSSCAAEHSTSWS
jgi:hypothetical protein